MTDQTVQVEGLTTENAVLLLAAAEELELDASVVQTTTDNVFVVPAEVAKKAGLKAKSEDDEPVADGDLLAVDETSTKAELQEAAKQRGLPTSGNKDDLLVAVNEHDSKGA
jgi:hypothetical protein